MNCDHYERREYWVEGQEGDWGWEEGYWHQESICLQEDISLGAFKCTRCGEVGYYTGKWKDYYEKGIPCFGSDKVKEGL